MIITLIASNSPYTGKTFLANLLSHFSGHTIINFADALKEELEETLLNNPILIIDIFSSLLLDRAAAISYVYKLVDLGPDHLANMNGSKEIKDKYRLAMQLWGTEYRRKEDPNYWIKKLALKIKPDISYLVPDCRFENELNFSSNCEPFIIDHTIKSIYLYNPDAEKQNHESEQIKGIKFSKEFVWYPSMNTSKSYDVFSSSLNYMNIDFSDLTSPTNIPYYSDFLSIYSKYIN